MYKSIPTYNSETGWSTTEFKELKDFILFIKSKISKVGKYDLYDSYLFREQAIKYESMRSYTKLQIRSKDWINYWEFEKLKSTEGVIINGFYLTEHYYFYLNFCPIYNVIEQSTEFPEVWDSHYEYCLKSKLAFLTGKHVGVLKKRRWGFSYLECADLHRYFIFERDSICKLLHKEEDPNQKNFRIIESYRNFTNQFTGWKRPIMGGYPSISQKIEVQDANTKQKSFSGRMSVLECVSTKQNPAKGVGLYLTKGLYDEAGTNSSVVKSISYNEKSIKQGGILRGKIVTGGSVGELKDSDGIKEIIYSPEAYGFYYDEDELGNKYGIFIPESSNYADEVRDSEDDELIIGYKKYYDADGNSDVEGAVKAILKSRLKLKERSPQAYRLSISQGPLTIKEAFDEREENIFPTHIISDRHQALYEVNKVGHAVKMYRNELGQVKHKFVDNKKVRDFPVKKNTDREGSVIIHEFPINNPPQGLYFAAVDPVGQKKTMVINSDSLMSVYIMKGRHAIEGEFEEKTFVAEYCGRYDNYEDTYNQVQMLCEFYNARTLVENNSEYYIQWLIKEKKQRLLVKKSELTKLKEVVPMYGSLAEYGVNMSPKLKDYLMELLISYIEQPISKQFDDVTGEASSIYGVHSVKDIMLLEEMLKWTPNINTDRLIAASLCLWVTNMLTEQAGRIVTKKPEEENFIIPKRGLFNRTVKPQFTKAKMF